MILANYTCMENFEGNYTRPKSFSKHKTVILLSKDTDQLLGGRAELYIHDDFARLDVFAHVYTIGGDIHGSPFSTKPEYTVAVTNNSGKRIVLGKLKSSSDNVYKLSFTTDDLSILKQYTTLVVDYNFENISKTILYGNFAA